MKSTISGKLLILVGGITAAAAVCVSIYLNPPSAVKAHSLDQQRLQGLQQIDFAIKNYYHTHQVLPDRLHAIENRAGLSSQANWRDPVTHQPFEYGITGTTTYQLCASFSGDSEQHDELYSVNFRQHHKGRDCFQQEVNTQ